MADLYDDLYEEKKEEKVDLQMIFSQYINRWPWFVASLLVCLLGAWLYLRYTTPMYNISASVLIKDEKKGGGGSGNFSALEDFGFISSSQNIDNEIEILRSKALVKNVVKELDLYITYHSQGRFNDSELYQTSPIVVELAPEEEDKWKSTAVLELTLSPDSSLLVTSHMHGEVAHKQFKKLPASWSTEAGVLFFKRSDKPTPHKELTLVTATIAPPQQVAKGYANALSVEATSKTTSIAILSLKNSNKQRGELFINKLIEVYNRNANEDKNEITQKTAEFISERIDIIDQELGSTEKDLENFKREAGLTNLSNDAQIALSESVEYEKKLVENGTQIRLVSYLTEEISKSAQEHSVLPSNVGLTDASLAAMIERYNVMVMERNRLLRTSSETNPVIVNLDNSLRATKANIQTTLASVQNGLLITQSAIERQTGKFNQRISNAPNQERQFISISRQQEIKAGLYLMLLQKREESAITLAATTNNAQTVDEAQADEGPVSPKTTLIFLIALVAGIALPVGVIYLMGVMQFKIENATDVEKLTSVPLIGCVPLAPAKDVDGYIAIQENKNDSMAENFRNIRTNLQFILEKDQKAILVTSTISGEGKTFIATNLAISLALLGKKVVVVGLDIRNPQLNRAFNLSNKEKGITQYLAHPDDENLMALVQPSHITPHLSILPCGTIPPNPTELLAREALAQSIHTLKEKFDYVIIDTAPIGLVTDTLIIGRVADASLYVCRANYTHKNSFNLMEELNQSRKMPQLCTIINGVSKQENYYGYGKYRNYGYGNTYHKK